VASTLLRLRDVPLMGGEVLRLHVPQTRVLPSLHQGIARRGAFQDLIRCSRISAFGAERPCSSPARGECRRVGRRGAGPGKARARR
jgi:hypothetical protein